MTESRRIEAADHFSLETARRMAWAAELAYRPAEFIEQAILGDWRGTWFRYYDVESTQCFAAADGATILVCFRGTEAGQLEDWVADLDFELVAGPWQGKVHAGFYDALSCVWRLLDADVERLLAEGPRQLWVTGHSLGAALAALAVGRWLEGGRPVAGLYTFGQPRTGDRTFARHFDFAFRPYTFRVVNHLDVVTRTPPRSLGYWHLGTFIYLTETGQLSFDFGWWQRFLQGWQGAIEMILDWGAEGLEDHRLQGYRRALDRAGAQPGGGAAVPAQPPVLLPYPRGEGPLIRPRRRAA